MRPESDAEFTQRMLQGVSRTFALTIPELPVRLRDVVANGYLLCRIADTIEDEPGMTIADKRRFHERFIAAVAAAEGPDPRPGEPASRVQAQAQVLAEDLTGRLSGRTLEAERELVQELSRVLRLTHGFSPRQRAALSRCVRIMCTGMNRFQGPEPKAPARRRGLEDLDELHTYCYFVAGVVGEMLTELFCEAVPEIEAHREALEQLTVSFGQGLQMTNILKDLWDDLEHGFCWLPRDVFASQGFDLDDLTPGQMRAFVDAARAIDPDLTGAPLMIVESGKAVVKAFQESFLYALLATALVLALLLKNPMDILRVLGTLLVAGLLTGACMELAGIQFNFANVIALPLLLGIGVDSGVHVLHRARLRLESQEAILHSSTARAVVLSSLTTFCSFANLSLSSHRGTASMGFLLALGVTWALVASLVVLPAFLPGAEAEPTEASPHGGAPAP